MKRLQRHCRAASSAALGAAIQSYKSFSCFDWMAGSSLAMTVSAGVAYERGRR